MKKLDQTCDISNSSISFCFNDISDVSSISSSLSSLLMTFASDSVSVSLSSSSSPSSSSSASLPVKYFVRWLSNNKDVEKKRILFNKS